MDNLQWFKFSPADWMMGRIQRQSPQVQVDFLRLCCQYWKNEGYVSCEDAELETMDSYATLVKYKIIKVENNSISIDFLDIQLDNVEDKRLQASNAGKLSAKSRKRKADAEKRAAEFNDRSTTVEPPLNEPPTDFNRVEESREEKSREEQTKSLEPLSKDEKLETEFDIFWKRYNKKIGRVDCEREWLKIDKPEYSKILEHVPKFVIASGQFLKTPLNYLKGRLWQDEDLPNYADKSKAKNTTVFVVPSDGYGKNSWDE